MALYKCSECGHSISEFTKVCPKCGADGSGERSKKIAEKSSVTFGLLAIVAIAVFVGAYLFSSKQDSRSQSQLGRFEYHSKPRDQGVQVREPQGDSQVHGMDAARSPMSAQESITESYYVCCHSAYTESNDADAAVENLRNRGFDADRLWIPDFASLSGAQKHLVFIGKYGSRSECETQLHSLRESLDAGMYGALVSTSDNADYIR